MKIDFSKTITDFDGEPIPRPGGKEDEALTLGFVCEAALLAERRAPQGGGQGGRQEAAMGLSDKLKRCNLARDIHKGGEVEVPIEDVPMIRAAIAEVWTVIIVGQADELLPK